MKLLSYEALQSPRSTAQVFNGCDGEEVPACGGHVIVVPAGVSHGFHVTGDRTLEMISLHTAAEMETQWL